MPVHDPEGAKYEQMFWSSTGELRWYRPKGATDDERVLQQLWERITGERHWRDVECFLED